MCRLPVFIVGLATAAVSSRAAAVDRLVTTSAELTTALQASIPGDSVILRNGVWNNLSVSHQTLNGSIAAPIQIRAQTPGKVVIAGPNYFFDVGGSNYEVSGLTFRDENANLKSIRFRGNGVNVHDNAILLGGRYNQVIWDAQPATNGTPSSFHNNFIAGKQDRGVTLQLDGSFRADVSNNYFGFRPTGGPSANSNGWETIRIGNSGIMSTSLQANIHNNYFEATEGEAETISDKTQDNRVAGNTFRNVSKGWVTARHGGGGVYEDNTFVNSLGIRVGNSDDTIADHPRLTIRNNYIEGPNAKILLPGSQTQVTIERNTVIATAGGSYNGATYTTGRFPLEYMNATSGTINDNLFWISDGTHAAVQAASVGGIAPTATGSGNIAYNAGTGPAFQSSTPTTFRTLFQTTNPTLARDAYNILRPTAAATQSAGVGALTTATSRNSTTGPSWLDPVKRLNKLMPLELRCNADLSNGITSSTADNTGYLSTAATLQNGAGASMNLHSANATGVSGVSGDLAFDNRATTNMGGAGGGRAAVVNQQWFRGLEAFTLQGWFKSDGAQSIGNGASLIEQTDANGGWSLRAATTGVLTLAMNSGSSTRTAASNVAFGAQDEWTFFAVTFDARPSSNEVSFYVGSETGGVTLAGTKSINLANTSDTVTADLLIGAGFDGLLDNIRLFSARQSINYIDDTGNTFTKTGNGQNYAVLSLAELQVVRRFDLGIPVGDLNESRTVNATDIDLLTSNIGNADYDIDGDGDADRADFDLLIYDTLGTRPGDANLDRDVNFQDLVALAQSYGNAGGWAQGDFDGNQIIDFNDLVALAQNYGIGSASIGMDAMEADVQAAGFASVFAMLPEPGAFGSLAGGLCLARRRRFEG